MKKNSRVITSILIIIIFYLFLSNVLKKFDNTPKWCDIKHPKVVTTGKPFVLEMKYKNIKTLCRLRARIHCFDKQGKWCAQFNAKEPSPQIIGDGEYKFTFYLKPDKRYSTATISLTQYGLSGSRNRSIAKFNQPAHSARLQIVSIKESASAEEDLSFTELLTKSLDEGFWTDKHGDPFLVAWFITLSYLIVSFLCVICMRHISRISSPEIPSTYKWLWLGLAFVLLILGINKQLDLQILIADIGRTTFKESGWYMQRRTFQLEFISVLITAGFAFLLFAGYSLRKIWKDCWPALLGASLLVCFILVRAVSFHDFDLLLKKRVAGLHLYWILELSGIFCIGFSAIQNYLKTPSPAVDDEMHEGT